jgi:ribosomal protein L37AE/L43A
MMHGNSNLKFIVAKQAKAIYQCNNTKRKLCRTNAAIWYNRTCRHKKLTPAYINIRINGKSQQCQRSLRIATQHRINQENKYLYIKKLKLNEHLYKLHLDCAAEWSNIWSIILQNIYQKLTQEMETHYNNLNRKLDKLQNKQQGTRKTNTSQQHNQFYRRKVNLNKIKFTHEEMSLLNNGLKHSIEKPLEKYWTDLVMETEQAIRMLEPKMQSPYRILATRKLKQIKTSNSHHNAEAKRQSYILKDINNKLRKEDAMITKADKGKTCVIIYNNDYTNKVQNFLDNNL